MRHLSRREWAELCFAHPDVDLSNPTDEFAVDLLEAVGADPDVWESGGETEARETYLRALNLAQPDRSWAFDALDGDANLAVEVALCNELGVAHSTFLGWPDRDQDLAFASAVRKADTCPAGHPREAMTNPDLMRVHRVHCAVCARTEELNEAFREATPEARRGFHVEVTRVPR